MCFIPSQLELRNGRQILVCACGRAFAVVTDEGLEIKSKHKHQAHTNMVTPDDLRRLADLIEAGMKKWAA